MDGVTINKSISFLGVYFTGYSDFSDATFVIKKKIGISCIDEAFLFNGKKYRSSKAVA